MSEIRRTTSIEIDEPPSTERGLSLADLLAGAGWLAYQGGRLAAKGAIAGVKLAAHAVQHSGAHAGKPLTISGAKQIIERSPDAAAALRELAARPGMEIPVDFSPQWKQTLASLSPESNKGEVMKIAEGMIRLRQDRLQATTSRLVAEACAAIGFSPKPLNGSPGLVTATGAGTRKITVEVAKDRDGGLRMHLDAHGFHGGECIRALDALQRELAERGVSFHVDSRQRKDRAPAIDGTGYAAGHLQCRTRL
jgi:hypothetical protein